MNGSISGHRNSVSARASASCGSFSSIVHTCVECLSLRTWPHHRHSSGLLTRHPFPLSPEQLAPSWQPTSGAPFCLFDSLCQQRDLLPDHHPKPLPQPVGCIGSSVSGPHLKLEPFTESFLSKWTALTFLAGPCSASLPWKAASYLLKLFISVFNFSLNLFQLLSPSLIYLVSFPFNVNTVYKSSRLVTGKNEMKKLGLCEKNVREQSWGWLQWLKTKQNRNLYEKNSINREPQKLRKFQVGTF